MSVSQAVLLGFRLYLLCAPDGMPIAFELAAANVPERVVAAEMLQRVALYSYTVIADKSFTSKEFEQIMAGRGTRFLGPGRQNEARRHNSLGAVRQWIESVFRTCKGQLTLEHHGAPRSKGSASASRCDCSSYPRASSTTNRSVSQAATSPPTATDAESTV